MTSMRNVRAPQQGSYVATGIDSDWDGAGGGSGYRSGLHFQNGQHARHHSGVSVDPVFSPRHSSDSNGHGVRDELAAYNREVNRSSTLKAFMSHEKGRGAAAASSQRRRTTAGGLSVSAGSPGARSYTSGFGSSPSSLAFESSLHGKFASNLPLRVWL